MKIAELSLWMQEIYHRGCRLGLSGNLEIGENGANIIASAEKKYQRIIPENPKDYDWLEPSQCIEAENYKTTLQRMSKTDFDLIERCGYEVTMANLGAYSSKIL